MRPALLAPILSVHVAACAGGLQNLAEVDLIELEPKTFRAQLVVLLEDDRVNSQRALRDLLKKVNNYLSFVRSAQLNESAPNASSEHRPIIVVYGPKDATSGEMQNLAGLRLAGEKAGVQVGVRAHQPGLKPRPIRIKFVGAGGAGGA